MASRRLGRRRRMAAYVPQCTGVGGLDHTTAIGVAFYVSHTTIAHPFHTLIQPHIAPLALEWAEN